MEILCKMNPIQKLREFLLKFPAGGPRLILTDVGWWMVNGGWMVDKKFSDFSLSKKRFFDFAQTWHICKSE